MTKCYLDSNILIYLSDESSSFFDKSLSLVSQLEHDGINLFVSPLCLDETVHEIGKKLRLKEPKNVFKEIKIALNAILDLPNLKLINPPLDFPSQLKIIEIMEKFSLRPRDAYHLLTIQEYQIDGFATFDNDFKKVFQAKLLTPAL